MMFNIGGRKEGLIGVKFIHEAVLYVFYSRQLWCNSDLDAIPSQVLARSRSGQPSVLCRTCAGRSSMKPSILARIPPNSTDVYETMPDV